VLLGERQLLTNQQLQQFLILEHPPQQVRLLVTLLVQALLEFHQVGLVVRLEQLVT
jgi:hypothetical protein